jgi:hypothetical protein
MEDKIMRPSIAILLSTILFAVLSACSQAKASTPTTAPEPTKAQKQEPLFLQAETCVIPADMTPIQNNEILVRYDGTPLVKILIDPKAMTAKVYTADDILDHEEPLGASSDQFLEIGIEMLDIGITINVNIMHCFGTHFYFNTTLSQ